MLDSSGARWLWGSNDAGQFGRDDYESELTPCRLYSDIETVVIGYNVIYAINKNHELWVAGNGVLGLGETQEAPLFQKVMDNVLSVSTRYTHAVAIKEDHTLWAWGSNKFGQLGNGTTDSSIPVQVMEHVTAASAGYLHTAYNG